MVFQGLLTRIVGTGPVSQNSGWDKFYSWGRDSSFWGRDACLKISMELLGGTNLGVAQVNFKPKRYHPKIFYGTEEALKGAVLYGNATISSLAP